MEVVTAQSMERNDDGPPSPRGAVMVEDRQRNVSVIRVFHLYCLLAYCVPADTD